MKGGEINEEDQDQKDQDHQDRPPALGSILARQTNRLQVIAVSWIKYITI